LPIWGVNESHSPIGNMNPGSSEDNYRTDAFLRLSMQEIIVIHEWQLREIERLRDLLGESQETIHDQIEEIRILKGRLEERQLDLALMQEWLLHQLE